MSVAHQAFYWSYALQLEIRGGSQPGEVSNMKIKVRATMLTLAVVLGVTACDNGPGFEYIHLPGTEPAAGANMPFTSAMASSSRRSASW